MPPDVSRCSSRCPTPSSSLLLADDRDGSPHVNPGSVPGSRSRALRRRGCAPFGDDAEAVVVLGDAGDLVDVAGAHREAAQRVQGDAGLLAERVGGADSRGQPGAVGSVVSVRLVALGVSGAGDPAQTAVHGGGLHLRRG
jgi:hypothetical protein